MLRVSEASSVVLAYYLDALQVRRPALASAPDGPDPGTGLRSVSST